MIAPHLTELAAEYRRCAEQLAIRGEAAPEPVPGRGQPYVRRRHCAVLTQLLQSLAGVTIRR